MENELFQLITCAFKTLNICTFINKVFFIETFFYLTFPLVHLGN